MAKNKKPKTTVNVEAVKREVKRMGKDIAQNDPSPMGRELAPGSVQRQSPLEQEMGTGKYRQMIHDHNDKNKHILDRLPFTFPRKRIVRSHRTDVLVECVECGHEADCIYGVYLECSLKEPKKKMEQGKCEKCHWWDNENAPGTLGKCRWFPPIPRVDDCGNDYWEWPMTCPKDWCCNFDYKRKEPDDE